MESVGNATLIAGDDPLRPLDALLINAPLRDYASRERLHRYTLPVLGLAYIATYAREQGFNVGVLDAEAHGLGPAAVARIANRRGPAWVGLNLLAPTYVHSARISELLDPSIRLLVGGHHAKALPEAVLRDRRFSRAHALVIGEGETRVSALLRNPDSREHLPGVLWVDRAGAIARGRGDLDAGAYLAPDINALPFVDRAFLTNDPYVDGHGRLQAAMVGARGCPYDCSFCGAAVSANPDITIRVRQPANIVREMENLRSAGVDSFRFVDDLFLGTGRVIERMADGFESAGVGEWARWDATGRINVLSRTSDEMLERLVRNGLREVALGIESGSQRVLDLIDKRITPAMTIEVVERLTQRGVNVKGYFIAGFPTETKAELGATEDLVDVLQQVTSEAPGHFRASMFEYRPYPGTPDWGRLMASGVHTQADLLNYSSADDLAGEGEDRVRDRDEFNFSVGIQFGDVPVQQVRDTVHRVMRKQAQRGSAGSER